MRLTNQYARSLNIAKKCNHFQSNLPGSCTRVTWEGSLCKKGNDSVRNAATFMYTMS